MNLNEKIDLLLKRQERQDVALINISSLIMNLRRHIYAVSNATGILFSPVFLTDTEVYEPIYLWYDNLATSTSENMKELHKAIRKNLEADRFKTYKFKVTVKHEQTPSL